MALALVEIIRRLQTQALALRATREGQVRAQREIDREPPGRDPTAQLRQEIAELERERILDALEKSGGNHGLAAERLGVSRRTLVYRLSTLRAHSSASARVS